MSLSTLCFPREILPAAAALKSARDWLNESNRKNQIPPLVMRQESTLTLLGSKARSRLGEFKRDLGSGQQASDRAR